MTAPLEEEEAPTVVAVTRTVGGVVLCLVGFALILFGAFWLFLVPWFGWATEGFWNTMAEWADLGGVGTITLGFVLAVVGGALIQRARKRRLQVFLDAAALTGQSFAAADTPEQRRAENPPPPTIL